VEKDDNPKHLHIDNFPEDVKKAAKKKAIDTHPNFKSWVIDLFNAAATGENHGGFRVVRSANENGQRMVRPSSPPGAGKTPAKSRRNKGIPA
jgi:hypothetical protein